MSIEPLLRQNGFSYFGYFIIQNNSSKTERRCKELELKQEQDRENYSKLQVTTCPLPSLWTLISISHVAVGWLVNSPQFFYRYT